MRRPERHIDAVLDAARFEGILEPAWEWPGSKDDASEIAAWEAKLDKAEHAAADILTNLHELRGELERVKRGEVVS